MKLCEYLKVKFSFVTIIIHIFFYSEANVDEGIFVEGFDMNSV